MVKAYSGDTAMLKVDARLTKRNGDSLAIDWSTVHTTSPTYVKPQLAHMRNRVRTRLGRGSGKDISPALRGAQKHKHHKYSRLITIIKMQKWQNLRSDKVEFRAPIVSHAGEFSSDLFEVVAWLCTEAYQYYLDTICFQPAGPKRMVSVYRRELLDSLAMANAKGVGMLLINN